MVNLIAHHARFLSGLFTLSLSLLLLTACGGGSSQGLLVFAAASLADPLSEIGGRFTSETGLKVDFSFDGSGALAQRIRRGAPVDLFISAGAAPMELLEVGGWVDRASQADLLTNRLVLITPRGREPPLQDVKGLTSQAVARIAIADPSLAPAGAYAREALESLGVWWEVEQKIVPASSVRIALAYVESGVADAGIVYHTDAATSDRVRVVLTLPVESHSLILYPAAVVRDTRREGVAREFLEFLQGEEAREIFRRHGFTPLG